MRRALGAATLVLGLAGAADARAQPAPNAVAAEEMFRDGRALLEKGRFAEACAKLDASEKLDAAVGTLFSLGECYEGQSRLASAWFAYRGAAALATQRGDPRRAMAQRLAEALDPRLARIAIHLAAGSGDVAVTLDGGRIVPDALGTPLPVDPGPHRVEARAAVSWSTVAQVPDNGALVEVEIPRLAASPPGGQGTVGSTGAAWKRPLALALVGTGAATVAVGAVFGMQAIVKGRDANRACPDGPACADAGAVHDSGLGKTYADLSTVLIPVGAALATVGGVLLLTSRASVETTASPTAARLDVRWTW
jgi:hypothetical protein